MSNASNLLDNLAQAWEDAIREAPQAGDTFIYKSPTDGYYNVGMARWSLRPDQYRILERAPKPEPKPRVVMASWVLAPDHREPYTLQDAGEWESLTYAVEADDLVDPVEMVEMPSFRELGEALAAPYFERGSEWPGTDTLVGAVLELLRGER